MALSAGRTTPRRLGATFGGPVAASVTIYEGGLVSRDSSGYLRPARASTSDIVVGVARETVTNGSTAGAISVTVDCGIFRVDNTSSAVTQAHMGQVCYAVDDCTVDIDNDAGARIIAGVVRDVDSSGVWVEVGTAQNSPTILPAAYVAGDILVHDGTRFVRLAKGTDGQVLKMVSGSVAWAADAT